MIPLGHAATDVIDWLDKHDGSMIVLLTLALVLATVYYARQNRNMVSEMREARRLTMLRKLAIKIVRPGPAVAFPAVRNVGPGPALDVRITLSFEPRDPSQHERDVRTWRTPLIAPGEQHDFVPLHPGNGGIMDLNALAATYDRITLTGILRRCVRRGASGERNVWRRARVAGTSRRGS